MKKIFNIVLVSVSAAALLASCDLDLTPKGSISYDPENIITNETDLNGFRAGVLANFRGLDYGSMDWVSDVQMDYFNAVVDYGNNGGDVHRANKDMTASSYNTEANWTNCYYAINKFNILIEGARKVPSDLVADAAVARGEAFLGRAVAYTHLARHFAKPYGSGSSTDLCVPLVTVYNQTERPARATVQKVYAQIKSDLDSAAVLLAGVKGAARSQYPTIDAVNAAYARYYIDTKDYTKAAESAKKVIDTGIYKLASTAEELSAVNVDDEGTEAIVQFYASLSEGIGYHSYYTQMSKDSEYGVYYRPYYIPTAAIVNAYDEGDFRRAVWFDNTNYYCYVNTGWYKDEFYVFTKYIGNPDLTSSGIPNAGNAIKPFMISEMYLIAAEAYAQSGNTASAKAVLNTLQEARGAIATDGSLSSVKKEWFRETVGEGLRMSCLKRWGDGYTTRAAQESAIKATVVMEGTDYTAKSLPASDYHFLWPIPTYEMQVNLNLVQNEGYAAE